MEYLIGLVAGIAVMTSAMLIARNAPKNIFYFKPEHSQSRTFDLIRTALYISNNINSFKPELKTQATNHYDRNSLKVMFLDGRAYWIKDNQFYCADLVDGNVDQETAKPVDTMGMDKVQLDKMFFIVQKLTEGKADDRRSSGNS